MRGCWGCNRTSQKVNELLGGINSSGALAAFEKMEEKGRLLLRCSFGLNPLLLQIVLVVSEGVVGLAMTKSWTMLNARGRVDGVFSSDLSLLK